MLTMPLNDCYLSFSVCYLLNQKIERTWNRMEKHNSAETIPHSTSQKCSREVIYKVPENTAAIWDSFPNDQSSGA